MLTLEWGLPRPSADATDPSMFGSGRNAGIWSAILSKILLAVEPAELSVDAIDSALDGGRVILLLLF